MVAMRLPLLGLLLAGSVAFAGCLGAPEPVQPSDAEDPASTDSAATSDLAAGAVQPPQGPPPQMAILPFAGRITLSVGAQGMGYFSPTGSQDPHAFVFPVGLREQTVMAIVAELRWPNNQNDLDMELAPPGCDMSTGLGPCVFVQGGTAGNGDSPVKFVLTDPGLLALTGDWHLQVWAKNAVATNFDGVITVFYGMAPSDDYTALE